jgi:diacylglycerol O-acyltransferase
MIFDAVDMLGGGVRTALGVSAITAKMLQRRFFDHDTHVALPLSAPRTALNVTPGAARTIAFTSYALEDLRAIGKAQGATINDVVITMCDMAVSHYFEQHGTQPRGSLVAYMPVNIRTDEEDGDGNLVTLLQVKLASTHRDTLSSLDEVRESIASAREVFSGAARPAVQYYSMLVALFAQLEETLNLGRFLPPVNNLVISNVPGSRVKRYLKGAEAVAMCGQHRRQHRLNVTC